MFDGASEMHLFAEAQTPTSILITTVVPVIDIHHLAVLMTL